MVIKQNDRILAYINDVCSQIKFREVHKEIQLELKSHLQEIVEEYLSEGFSEDEAVGKAIAQMGSAEIVGRQLDKVHKPKPEWTVLTLSLLFAGLGLLSIYFMEKQGLFASASASIPMFTRSIAVIIIGAVVVTGLYLFDYRKLEPFSKHIYLGTVFALTVLLFVGQPVIGKPYFSVGFFSFDMAGISTILFSIALAGILNKWDWNNSEKLAQLALLCLVPLILILASHSLATGVIYCITCIALVIVSGAGPRDFLILTGLVSGMILLPIINDPYRLNRLTAFIHPEKDLSGMGWLGAQLSKLIDNSGLYGQGLALKPEYVPGLHTDFIFSYITFAFGWIAGGVLAVLVAVFIIRIMLIATAVKSSYARLLVTGFVAIFAVQFLWNILMNLGFAPLIGVGLPFVSYGGSQLIFNAAALGIIFSVYRRRNLSGPLIDG
ncbi:cell division protein FtsW [Desulfocucumis palustris]|uniref:Cell division protein FtsW n=1 Tax=Desulfocucumis palustris TaxID=1898651 RepID=A0A2L2XEU1_9FIRM|nr:FtsW/RodA/SpoVE family cell cycle protein [Desulfocucumis palustris]GBF34223.1 cell division protein FtsW [Desulfocucumis palustris]